MRATVGQIIPEGTRMSEVAKMGVRLATDGTGFYPFHCFSEDQESFTYEQSAELSPNFDRRGHSRFDEFNPTTINDVQVLVIW